MSSGINFTFATLNIMASSSRLRLQATHKLFPAVNYDLFRRGIEAEVKKALWLLETYGTFRISNHGLSPKATAASFLYVSRKPLFASRGVLHSLF